MAQYTKPFLSIEEQIDLITSRGLLVSDNDLAVDCLRNIGYYRLSGYWYPLRKSSIVTNPDGSDDRFVQDEYREGATFDHVIQIYTYDKHLRLLLLDVLEQIEIALRTDVTLQLGQYSPWAYREPQYLDQRFVHEALLGTNETQFTKFVSRCDDTYTRSKSDFVVHFRGKYSGHLPFWSAVELWDFGMLSIFISGLKYRDKRAIAAKYNIPPELLPSWVRTLADLRNICAHHGRLWNKTLVSQPRTANIGIADLSHINDGFAKEKIYSVIAIARHMQRILNPTSTWADSIISLNESFPEAPGIEFKHMGYPDNWRGLDLWRV